MLLRASLGRNMTTHAAFLFLGEECALYDPSWEGGKEHKKTCMWIPPDSACLFSPYDPAVYSYYFDVINLSHEYNYI